MTDIEKFENRIKNAQIYPDGSVKIEFPKKEEVEKTSSSMLYRKKTKRNYGVEKTAQKVNVKKEKIKKNESNETDEINLKTKELNNPGYKRIEKYEEPEELEEPKSWIGFKVTLAMVLLSAVIAIGKGTYDKVNDFFSTRNEETSENITLEIIDDEEIAQNKVDSIKENSGYEFENLTNKELLDGVSRIALVENKMHIYAYQRHFFDSEDQILLEKILKDTYGEEYETYSEEKIRDLKKLAYELLGEDKEKQEYVRDPERVRAAEEKRKEKLNTTKDEREIGE